MDEMRIRSKFMKNTISKLAHKAISKKTGYDVDILFYEIEADYDDYRNNVTVHVNADIELSKEELSKLLKSIGLD